MIKKYEKENGKIIGILENGELQNKSVDSSKVSIDVLYCGICGTDYQKFIGMNNVEEWGHEIIGKLHNQPNEGLVTIRTTFPCESCEYCKSGHPKKCREWNRTNFNGFSNKIQVDSKSVIFLNEKKVDIVYSLVEPLYVANSLIKNVYPVKDSIYSIVGNGTIGLLTAFLIKKIYNSEVRIIGRRNLPNKEKFIELIDAKYYDISKIEEALKNCERIIITSPYNTLPQVIDHAEPFSNITFNGISKQTNIELSLNSWHFKNLNIWPSFPHPQSDFDEEIKIIKENKDVIRSIITNIYPLEKIEKALNDLNNKSKDNIKILIDCSARGNKI